ncbi:MAG: hypothetical protein NTW96_25455 [Planctomycetia bacterium]|nr:hypothetical protein [Planctomycetia bacterium]
MTASIVTESAIAKLHAALARAEQDQEVKKIIAARDQVLARYQAVFAPDHLPLLTEEEFKGFLLFENNRHWTGLARKGYSLCGDMSRLREALTILLDEGQPIQQRLDRLVPKASPRFLRKFGKALITAILHVAHPDKYGVYNGTSEAGMKAVSVLPSFERGASFGERYVEVNRILHELASGLESDLWTLDALWWLMKPKRAKQTPPKPRPPRCIPTKRLALCKAVNVRRNVNRFMEGKGEDKGRHPGERYASFDYCYNYFRSFHEQNRIGGICCPENIHESCLQLAFYLASWGMYRNRALLKKSARIFTPLLEKMVQLGGRLWDVDMDSYTDENMDLLLEAGGAIREALGSEIKASDTLVTKIMLGVCGNVPAFDRYVKKGLEVKGFSRKSLRVVAAFYECHKDAIDRFQRKIRTIDFHTGEETNRHYTKAKIVDMAAFIEGQS